MFQISAQTAYADYFGKAICFVHPFDDDLSVSYRLCSAQEIKKAKEHICYPTKYTDDFWKQNNCLTTIPDFSYFQDERFFAPYKEKIKKMYKFSKPLPESAAKMAEKIKTANSVSIHIRRTDYIVLQYPILTLSYYESGADYIQEHTTEPIHLFVFSDDITWVKENFKSKYPFTIVEGNKDTVDMHLMSLCKHNIIANSTFSWWGAWLNENPDKIVVAPDIWLYENEHWREDIELEDWIVIPSGVKKRSED